MKYIKELDSIRAIAAFVVLIHHWAPGYGLIEALDGVSVFFVLSGFLITYILLDSKENTAGLNGGKLLKFKNFFTRRALRIFPLYFLILFLFVWFSGKFEWAGFKYYLTFTTNHYLYKVKDWNEIAHLWSISVEEQFYFFWPLLVFYLSKKYILPTIYFLIVLGFISQFYFPDAYFSAILLPTCLPSLGLGAFLGWFYFYKPYLLHRYDGFLPWLGLLSVLILIFYIFIFNHESYLPRNLSSMMGLILIIYIINNSKKSNILLRILRNRTLVFLGKISYGIYVYHYFIPHYSYKYLNALNNYLPPFFDPLLKQIFFLENLIIVLLVSFISYKFFELPILKFKYYFQDSKPKKLDNLYLFKR